MLTNTTQLVVYSFGFLFHMEPNRLWRHDWSFLAINECIFLI